MTENAWSHDPPEPSPPAPKAGDAAQQPRSVATIALERFIEQDRERLANGPTMAEWLDDVEKFRIPGLTTEVIVQYIREARDADDVGDLD